ncbi:MAG: NAD-dependent epimerase-dehydratase [Devosia sp.]|nr:NAD-dependent epimerase-dehydratase [Devosia sp.]
MTTIDTHAAAPVCVIGYGALGQEIVAQLIAAGRTVRIIQRSRPESMPPGAGFVAADIMDAAQLTAATAGAEALVCAIGLPYVSKLWEQGWPLAMQNLLVACEAHGVRLVFADNLYLYGPQDGPLTEDLPPVDYGRKPKSRAAATRLWQAAHAAGRVQAVAVRSPDFYGPGVVQSVLGSESIVALARGKTATLLGNADLPHDVAHVADYARAVITLLDAPDDAYGQAWHVPTAPTLTLRQHLQMVADALGVPLKLTVIPSWAARPLGLFVPFIREAAEMQFLFDRPYVVDASKFAGRFWSNVVPLETGLTATALSFRPTATGVVPLLGTAPTKSFARRRGAPTAANTSSASFDPGELVGQQVEDDADAPAGVDLAMRHQPHREDQRFELGQHATNHRLTVADNAVLDSDAQPVLHQPPHHQIILRENRKVVFGEVQAECVEALDEYPGPVDVDKLGVPQVVG